MMIITLKELFDSFLFYPEKLHYFDKSADVEDSIYEVLDMEHFVEENGDRKLEAFQVDNWLNRITLEVVLK